MTEVLSHPTQEFAPIDPALLLENRAAHLATVALDSLPFIPTPSPVDRFREYFGLNAEMTSDHVASVQTSLAEVSLADAGISLSTVEREDAAQAARRTLYELAA